MFLAGLTVWGIPAKRTEYTVVQPDGTTLKVRKVGDEHRHFTLTSDGLLLKKEVDGRYCYATLATDGVLKSTGVQAVDAPGRSYVPANAIDITDKRISKIKRNKMRRISQAGVGLMDNTFPSKGEPNVLIILVEYADVPFNLSDPNTYFDNMLNKEGFNDYGGTGSCRDYFRDNSMGQFMPHFDLYGPVKLPENRSYYGANDVDDYDINPGMMVVHAIEALDSEVDFSKYDNDGDGCVDNIYVFYAGEGESSSRVEETVWPHSADLNDMGLGFEVDGVRVNHYACSNEWEFGRPDGIGTFVHEFSHVLGLPDLYNTEDGHSGYTPEEYSVLDYGPYNNDGRTPPCYSIYERNALGWIEPEVISGSMDGKLENLADSNKGYIIPTGNNNEFFLLENRQQTGWDKYIPGHGMLIWHIDYDRIPFEYNEVNTDGKHQRVDIEEACGVTSISDSEIMASYPFPGARNITSFTDDTRPSMRTWKGERLDLPITEIEEKDGMVTFLVAGGSLAVKVPEPLEESEIEMSDKHFVAAWEPSEGAVDYEVSVYSVEDDKGKKYTCNMGEDGTLKLPSGWSSNSQDVYKTTGNYGESAPSLKFDATGEYIMSPKFDADITAISYWRKGQNTAAGTSITIYALTSYGWEAINTEEPENGVGRVYEVAPVSIPEGVRQLKFEYTKNRGNLAIDDIVISTGTGDELLMPYKDYSTQGATSLRVDQLKEGCKVYRFKVRASNGERYSAYSKTVKVDLSKAASAVEIPGISGKREYYDMLGRRVLHPAAGSILIERNGTTVRKVHIR